ncbi:DUF1727 domain-containing protein [Aerococcaceae bacterium DSM 111176]|nr:DUF1727 domain-containing protein [Aerococcaceae bacterium DSM 111176]
MSGGMEMSVRSEIARVAAAGSRKFLTTFTNGGTSLPGKLALSIDPNILESLATDYDVIVVTGTNGKTLTTSLIVKALQQKYGAVITNESGSNMKQGVVGAFLAAGNSSKRGIAVLEVDEGSLKNISPELSPKTFVHTNIFADQLDRYGSVENVYQLLVDACLETPTAKVISNGDIPVMSAYTLPNDRVFFGFDEVEPFKGQTEPDTTESTICPMCQKPLSYHFVTYANQGDFYSTCGFKRPQLQSKVTAIHDLGPDSSTFDIDGHTFELPVAGVYNIYNALAAYTVARDYDVSVDQIREAFKSIERVFGRQEKMMLEDKEIIFNLFKNPVGLNQVLQLVKLEDKSMSLAMILNNNDADGVDVDWIYESDFSLLSENDIQQVYASGMETETIAGLLDEAQLIESPAKRHPDIDALIDQLKDAPGERVHVVANYTAMMQFRQKMSDKGYL